MKNKWRKFDETVNLVFLMEYFGISEKRKTHKYISYGTHGTSYILISTDLGYRYYRPGAPERKCTPFDFILERISRNEANTKLGLWSRLDAFYNSIVKKPDFFLNGTWKNTLETVALDYNHFNDFDSEFSLTEHPVRSADLQIFENRVFENPKGQIYFPYRNLANNLTGYVTELEGKLSLLAESDISESVWFSEVPKTIKNLVVLKNPMEALAFQKRFQLEDVIFLALSDINYSSSKILLQILKRTKLKKMVLSFTGSSKIEGYIQDLMLISFINDSRFLVRVDKDHLTVKFEPEGQKPLAKLHNEILKYNGGLMKEYLKFNKITDQSLLDRKSIVLNQEKEWVACRIPYEVNALRYFLWSYYRNYMHKIIEIVKPKNTNWTLEYEENGTYKGADKLKAFKMAV
ncbi:hypothetical protein [Costertonia aggregata]|uniref:Uncharacterized protein n=1 Tax=Costertonia aggregata TaxID=343403 RepID=A0A7H9AT18_9FLAO|nr:hypothetical protein [Costertonia aggregata]QLG46594.1 hypothetical protein HYG79_14965 [Costertonia aggregata]